MPRHRQPAPSRLYWTLSTTLWLALFFVGCPNAPLKPGQRRTQKTPAHRTQRRKPPTRNVTRPTKRHPMRGKRPPGPRLPAGIPKGTGRGAKISPVYPKKKIKTHPLANAYCDAIHTQIEQRKALCCQHKSPSAFAATQCYHHLTYALKFKGVSLEAKDVEKCRAAMASRYRGCGWVTHLAVPVVSACLGIIRGHYKVNQRCRSSLECMGTLRCQGVGPTSLGTCAPAKPHGFNCGRAVDALAVYTRQDALERQHPECQGHCYRNRCVPYFDQKQPCSTDIQCGPSKHCAAGTCRIGAQAKAGQACVSACPQGYRCIRRRCQRPQTLGQRCTDPFACRGDCLLPPGKTVGVCGMRCSPPRPWLYSNKLAYPTTRPQNIKGLRTSTKPFPTSRP